MKIHYAKRAYKFYEYFYRVAQKGVLLFAELDVKSNVFLIKIIIVQPKSYLRIQYL